ncbi:5-3 exoribonuclease 3-like [Prunus yedoensis var. nudiflora]|uniref:5-3 exoribonuclease 3-like n=1 Tax=Prunus yedoensis var. nudiflora TaxID=2094558 RepID=A0A314XZM9_PRUYE|nr:5-3 exoribonuclease 3-like [Prunus yedoensis var. nudiflora]
MQFSSQLVQERFRKPDNMGNRGFRNNARFTSSSPNMIHKFSGTGWGCGRGKAIASPDFGYRFHAPGRIPCERVMSSSSYSAKGVVAYKKASLHETPVCNETWRVAGSGSGDQIRTLRDLKISKSSSSQGWRPNGRVQSANNFSGRLEMASHLTQTMLGNMVSAAVGAIRTPRSIIHLLLLTVHPKPVGVRTLFHVVGILKLSPAGS